MLQTKYNGTQEEEIFVCLLIQIHPILNDSKVFQYLFFVCLNSDKKQNSKCNFILKDQMELSVDLCLT